MRLRLNKGLTDTENGDLNTGHPIDESEMAARRLRMNLKANGLQSIEDVMFFDSDDEFADFVICPYAIIDDDKGTYYGAYTDAYKKAIEEGKKFVIAKGSYSSRANKDGWVVKQVLIPKSLGSNRKDVCVKLKVENVCDSWVEYKK
jgi:hypothetical protein